ncbi:unnamed protein product [Arctogadus glacialis]
MWRSINPNRKREHSVPLGQKHSLVRRLAQGDPGSRLPCEGSCGPLGEPRLDTAVVLSALNLSSPEDRLLLGGMPVQVFGVDDRAGREADKQVDRKADGKRGRRVQTGSKTGIQSVPCADVQLAQTNTHIH